MNGDKENFHDEIAEMAAERDSVCSGFLHEHDNLCAGEYYAAMQESEILKEAEKAKPYLGEGVIFGPRSMFGAPVHNVKPAIFRMTEMSPEDDDLPF